MQSALWRIFTLAFVVGLFGLPGLDCNPFYPVHAAAATNEARQKAPVKAKKSHSAQRRLTAQPRGLTTVQDVRTARSPGLMRLVLDLDAKSRPSKPPILQGEGVTITLPNAALSSSAKAKLASSERSTPFIITQTSARSVDIALPSGSFQSYTILTLVNPHRLVIDVVLPQESQATRITEPVPEETPSLPALPQPASPQPNSMKTVVIDPGHGGKDPGALGQRGTEEKNITLAVALKLRDLLSRQPEIRVLMTRERDEFIELENRAKFANAQDADLFVSIHVNSHPKRSVKGIEIYHFGAAKDQRALEVAARENGTPLSHTGVGIEYYLAELLTAKKIDESQNLAWTAKEAMVTSLNSHYTLVDHGVKTAPFYVLRYTRMPSILAEIAYISNAAEEEMLRTGLFTTRIAEALAESVKTFLGSAKLSTR